MNTVKQLFQKDCRKKRVQVHGSTLSGIVGGVFKFLVPSLLQHFRESLEKGVCT